MSEITRRDYSQPQEQYKQIISELKPIFQEYELKKDAHQQRMKKGDFTNEQHEQDNTEMENILNKLNGKVKELDAAYNLNFPQYPGQSVSSFFVEAIKENGIDLYRAITQSGEIEGEKGNSWILSSAHENIGITFEPNGDIKKKLKFVRYTQIPPEQGQRVLEDYEKIYVKTAGSDWQEQSEAK